MHNLKKKALNKLSTLNKANRLLCLLTLLLCACEEVPEHCGDRHPALDPSAEFCFGGKAYLKCGGDIYNPLTEGCTYANTVGTRCQDGSVVQLGTPCAGYTLTVETNPANSGNVTLSPNGPTYDIGTQVTVTATANEGFVFKGWSGAAVSAEKLVTIFMDGNKTLTANFQTTDSSGRSGGNTCTSGTACKQVTIGTQVWMAENLNIETAESWCYDNSPDSCAKYGRLYTWNAALTACPSGWHLPSRAEWDVLSDLVGDSNQVNSGTEYYWPGTGTKLKTKTGWNSYSGVPVGTDEFGFSALPGGFRYAGGFYDAGYFGRWWTPTENSEGNAYYRSIYHHLDYVANGNYYGKDCGFSVRCVSGSAPTYTITWNADGGSPVPATLTVNSDYILNEPGKMTKSGYIFNGWYTNSGLATKASFPMTITANTTLWAKWVAKGRFTDSRDGEEYDSVRIDNQVWMAKNLNYLPLSGNSWCYGDDNSNCDKYGRLYDWNTAMAGATSSSANPSGVKGVCPVGWHLPSYEEWKELMYSKVGNSAGTKLKSTSGWYNDGNGTDDFGFSALPGGYRYSDGYFYDAGSYGFWWTATEISDGNAADYRYMGYNDNVVHTNNQVKSNGFSVRCVMDD